MPEDYVSRWSSGTGHDPATVDQTRKLQLEAASRVRELRDAVTAACEKLRRDQHYATAERLEKALEAAQGSQAG